MPHVNRTAATAASICIFSALAVPSLSGCASSPKGNQPRVQGLVVPEGHTVNDRGQIVPDERLERGFASKGLAVMNQQLLVTAAILDTALDEANSERVGEAQDRLVTQRLLVDALRYRARRLEQQVGTLPEKEQFVAEPLRSQLLIMQQVSNSAASFASSLLERYFPNLRAQDFAGAKVRALEEFAPSSSGDGVAVVERAVVRAMLLTRAQNSVRGDATGIERKVREAEFSFYQSMAGMIGGDLKVERQNPGSLGAEQIFSAAALGQVSALELNRMQESNPMVVALSSSLSPEGARELLSSGTNTVESYARFNRFMAREFPSQWGSLTPGVQVETFLKISQRPINAKTYQGVERPSVEVVTSPTEVEQQAYLETMRRFTLQ